jgi:hypothetical protein
LGNGSRLVGQGGATTYALTRDEEGQKSKWHSIRVIGLHGTTVHL